jgi:hypothetical protein
MAEQGKQRLPDAGAARRQGWRVGGKEGGWEGGADSERARAPERARVVAAPGCRRLTEEQMKTSFMPLLYREMYELSRSVYRAT